MGITDWFRSRPPSVSPTLIPGPTSQVEALALRLADQAWLVHPSAQVIRIRLECLEGLVRVRSFDVPRTLPEKVHPRYLDTSLFTHTIHISGLCGALLSAIGIRPGWDEMEVEIRADEIQIGDQTLSFDPDQLMFGHRFMAALAALDDVLPKRQAALQARLAAPGPCRVSWVREEQRLIFTPEDRKAASLIIEAQVVGSYAPESMSWCWAWANHSFDTVHTEAIRSLSDRAGEGTAERMFGVGGFPCSESFAFTVATLAAERMGQRDAWRWTLQTGVQLFFALPPEEPPT